MSLRSTAEKGLYWVQWLLFIGTIVLGVISAYTARDTVSSQIDAGLKAPGFGNAVWFKSLYVIREYFAVIVIGTTAAHSAAGELRKSIGSSLFWGVLQDALDRYRSSCFTPESLKDTPEFEHRLTLFQHCTYRTLWYWIQPHRWIRCFVWVPNERWFSGPGRGWLLVVRRSGLRTKRSRSVFPAFDGVSKMPTGVAGRAYVHRCDVEVKDLPDLSGVGQSDESIREAMEQIKVYAERTWDRTDAVIRRLKQGKPMPTVIIAKIIEGPRDSWGVLVLDSRSYKDIKPANMRTCFEDFAWLLPTLLESGQS